MAEPAATHYQNSPPHDSSACPPAPSDHSHSTNQPQHIDTMKTKFISAIRMLHAAAALAVLLPSCSSVTGGSASVSRNSAGGDVPATIEFQRYRFRTGGAFRAAELGTIGLKRTSGANVFENRFVPTLKGLELSRSASFTKTTKSDYKLIGSLSSAEIQGFKLDGSATHQSEFAQSGIYTIYYLPNTKDLVDQLNSPENSNLRDYLRRSNEFRIITAVVKVNSHSLLRKTGSTAGIDFKILELLAKEGTAVADSKKETASEGGAKDVQITDKKAGAESWDTGLKIADGGTYAYEYSRILWSLEDGRIVDLLADQPGRWFAWTDRGDHGYEKVTTDPRKIRQ